MSKRAVILSGGKGTRLKPFTLVLPKSLMPIGEYPILEVIIRQLSVNGFKHITLAVNHQADLVKAFFGDGSKWGTKIDYSKEEHCLNTMGPLRLIKDLPNNFLIMNGDVFTDLDYRSFFEYHVRHSNLFTISSFIREQVVEYGVLKTDKKNMLIGFREKPVSALEVSMGIYMANRKILDFIPRDKAFGFDDLMLRLIRLKKNVAVKIHKGRWLDIGKSDDYAQAISEFERNKGIYLK
ncbi:MAG: sugar phosphate nucleotidyltransferase [Candidatus Omnitrophica bacterium]|nr:sugar phosphate nucleotidyltransferase [Candidatus Omnitrophota bacterium]